MNNKNVKSGKAGFFALLLVKWFPKKYFISAYGDLRKKSGDTFENWWTRKQRVKKDEVN